MKPFEIQLPKRTVFGRGKVREAIGTLDYKRPLIIHGSNPDRVRWLIDALPQNSPTAACANEPDLTMLEDALVTARTHAVDAVIAIGGGSALDLGKAVAGLARTTERLMRYLEVVGDAKPIDAEPIPFIAIPTTFGTGAEATRNAVISVPEHQRKVSIRDARMLAELVIIDPALSDGCPHPVTMASGLDAITQLVEPYVSKKANAFTDALVRQSLEPALKAICTLSEREDAEARDVMAFASHASGIALSHAGLGAVHGFAGVIGGITGAPHGEICATLLPPTLAANREALRRDAKPTDRLDEVEAMLVRRFNDQRGVDGFEKLASWMRQIGIRKLSEMGVAANNCSHLAELALASSSMKANPTELPLNELSSILQAQL